MVQTLPVEEMCTLSPFDVIVFPSFFLLPFFCIRADYSFSLQFGGGGAIFAIEIAPTRSLRSEVAMGRNFDDGGQGTLVPLAMITAWHSSRGGGL